MTFESLDSGIEAQLRLPQNFHPAKWSEATKKKKKRGNAGAEGPKYTTYAPQVLQESTGTTPGKASRVSSFSFPFPAHHLIAVTRFDLFRLFFTFCTDRLKTNISAEALSLKSLARAWQIDDSHSYPRTRRVICQDIYGLCDLG